MDGDARRMTCESTPAAWSCSDTELFITFGDVFVPRRHEQISTICDLLNDLAAPHVLDVCAGQGRLAEAYLRRKPNARVTLLDGSAEMLAGAETRLKEFGGRYELLQANIEERAWREQTSYDAVMTSLAVHHLDAEGKRALYRDVYRMLTPGGVFVMIDLVEAAGPCTRKLNGAHWAEAVRRASHEQYGSDEAAMIFEQTGWNYYRLTHPDPVDKPSSVAEHLDWLREAGFAGVDVVWMYAGHAIFTATRKATE
jgi:tRNA (cmo5U34)-methyltransferase